MFDLREKPFIVFWELTRACMLACKHCRAKAQKKRHPDELNTKEAFELMFTLNLIMENAFSYLYAWI